MMSGQAQATCLHIETEYEMIRTVSSMVGSKHLEMDNECSHQQDETSCLQLGTDYEMIGAVSSMVGSNHLEMEGIQPQTRTTADPDQERSETESSEFPTPRSWPEANTSIVLMCLLAAVGLLVMAFPFLPIRSAGYSFVPSLIIVRNIILALFAASSIVVMTWMTRKVVELHQKGMVLWPSRCNHCAFALMQIGRYDRAMKEGKTFQLDMMRETENIQTGSSLAISKVTITIVYIFSGLVVIFIIASIMNIYLCFDQHSSVSPDNATNIEVVTAFIVYLMYLLITYVTSFHLVPNYGDAIFVAVPRIRWSIALLIEVHLWVFFHRLVRPFVLVANSGVHKRLLCVTNGSTSEFVNGVLAISVPFTVEYPLMMTWLFFEMWLRFLPRYAHSIINMINKENKNKSIIINQGVVRRSNWKTIRNIFCISLKRERRMSKIGSIIPSHRNTGSRARHDQSQGMISLESVGMVRAGYIDGTSNMRQSDYVNVASRENNSKNKMNGALSNEIEKALVITLLICGVYFGMSKFFLAGDSKIRGRYLQWFLRIAFFTPIILMIFKHKKLIQRADGSHSIRTEGTSSQDNMLLITLTGAFLYEAACFVSSVGNLCNRNGLSYDEIVLNVVSVFASMFGVLRKYVQSIFLLCVQHLQPKDDYERKWTLLCLLGVGMMNATQWMFHSLVHEVESSVAWPVLVMFVDGNVGQLIGMLCTPFVHLYELHAAIIAYEVYKVIWSIKIK